MFLFYLIIVVMAMMLFFKTKKYLHMLQQNLYNENNRYLKWVYKNRGMFLNLEIFSIIVMAVGYFVIYDLNRYAIIAELFILIIYAILVCKWYLFLENETTKKPLVVTKRVRRLIITTSILYLIPVVILIINNSDIKIAWLMMFVLSIMIYLDGFVVFLANIINFPYERGVYYYYKNKAQTKLRGMPNLKIIGITGSYGKTSSKNILSDILNIKYNALPTPRNLNTYNGLIMTVNNNMDKFCDIFIAEMGAYVKGEIRGLCNLVHPKYGILTTIGTAHLESFGSEQNIIDAKFELIESLPLDGVGVLNGDDPKQVAYNLKNKCKIIWIGINNENVDVRASNIKATNTGMSFDVTFKGDSKKYKFETKLLGDHSIYNILAGLALGDYFGVDISDLQAAVKGVRTVEHRLELKRLGGFYMIDDAYNSNPVGAKGAVKVLGMMDGIKIVVTPGMIELGDREDELNEIFGEQIAEVADYVVLIGKEKTKAIQNGLKKKNYDFEKVVIYNDVRDAYTFINGIKSNTDEEVYALFENDLPDTYNE